MLRIWMGRANTGKTARVLQAIQEGGEDPGALLLCPEHASHRAEMELCRALGPGAARCAQVLSLRLLAGRVRRPAAWQRAGAALTALLHGVQDGQKFMALLLLTGGLGGEQPASRLSLALLTAAVMALGTALGGKPIVEKMGTELANLTPAEGLSADLGAGVVLLVCSALGLPVSTTHAKVSAICGAGRGADRRVMGQMAGAWALTFPVCGGVAFALTRLMMG